MKPDMFFVHPAVFDKLQGKPWDQKKWLEYVCLMIKDCSIEQLQDIAEFFRNLDNKNEEGDE